MAETDRAWLVGLLEGEGCFYHGDRLQGRGRISLSVTLRMTDSDVVARAAQLMGARSVNTDKPSNPKHSTIFVCGIYTAKAAALMRELLPLFGQRRQAKIAECLAAWDRKADMSAFPPTGRPEATER